MSVGDGRVKTLFVPSSETPPLADQFAAARFEFWRKVQFVQNDGHDTSTLFPEGLMVSVGMLINTEML